MPEPDPIAELLEQVAGEHAANVGPITGSWRCACGAKSHNGSLSAGDLTTRADRQSQYRTHLAEVQAAALRDAGDVAGASETEWAAVDDGRVIHIPGATCPADVLAETHGHGAVRVGVARRTVIRTPWQPINHGQENP
ncbi:hypothetical protein ACIRN4_06290 [Pimelobacter simplex]|uniref:hypothetical protein n=1 Tax=Nocardioides simplex TaxID=2045 RepID=UPI0037F737EF